MPHTVIILGGYGVFGSHIADQLSQDKSIEVVLVGRDAGKGTPFAHAIGAKFIQCDTQNTAALGRVIAGAHLVINASGPFQARNYTVPELCIANRCHYIDIGDGRRYVADINQLHPQATAQKVFVCVGASTAPAVTSAAVAELTHNGAPVRAIKIALTAGNKNLAGASTIATILSYVGVPIRVWQNGRWQTTPGWGAGEFIRFPAPVGTRRVQLCDMPDLELFPTRFKAETLVFKAGVELTLFNYAFSGLAALRQLKPALNLPALAAPLARLSGLFKMFGSLNGCVAVWVTAQDGTQTALALVARKNGPRVAAAPAVLLARKLLAGEVPALGAFPCLGFLTIREIADFLAPFAITLVRGQNQSWQP